MSQAGRATRVVSLVPSVTETLLAWGVVPVGVTRFCEQPDLRAVGGTKDPDVSAITGLAPDLVVLDRQENRAEDAAALAAAGVALHVLDVTSVADVGPALAGLAERLGVGVAGLPSPPARLPRVRVTAFIPIWRRPWMSINGATYGSSLLASAGVGNVFEGEAERYPTVTLDQAAARHPDIVLAPSEPYPFGERHRAELERAAPVVLADGRDLFWWGVRTPGAQRRLRTLVEVAAIGNGPPPRA